MDHGIVLDQLVLQPAGVWPGIGREVLRRFADTAAEGVRRMHDAIERGDLPPRTALLGRIRGTGPGVSFRLLVQTMEVAYPAPLRSPFEGSHCVAGAELPLCEILDPSRDDSFLRLRFDAGSVELPMHTHEISDRFIMVVRGRGFYHVSSSTLEEFHADTVHTVAVRTRDVLIFPRGTVHTFSTTTEPLHLLSYHAPHVPLEDPRQYTLPNEIVCPGLTMRPEDSTIVFDPAWNIVV